VIEVATLVVSQHVAAHAVDAVPHPIADVARLDAMLVDVIRPIVMAVAMHVVVALVLVCDR
jgi:hypothetical protein